MIPKGGRFGRFEVAYLDLFSASAKLVFAARTGPPEDLAAALAHWQRSYAELGDAYTEGFVLPG